MKLGNAPAAPGGVDYFTLLSPGTTTSSITPLGTRYEGAARVQLTPAQTAFLLDSNQNPPIPASGENSDLIYKAFPVELYPSVCGLPSPIDLMQHALGNCDMVAAMAGLAYGHPSYIPSLIKTTDNIHFKVTLFKPDKTTIDVGVNNLFVASADGTIQAVSGRRGVANWATVLEKAIEKYNVTYEVLLSGGVGQVGGMGSEHTLPMLVGNGTSYAFDRGQLSPTQLADEVRFALNSGFVITGGFGMESAVDGFRTVTAHGYTVLPPADANTMISMRNPWGTATSATSGNYDDSQDGVINIPFDSVWARTIDLRVMLPGAAVTPGYVTAYSPAIASGITSP